VPTSTRSATSSAPPSADDLGAAASDRAQDHELAAEGSDPTETGRRFHRSGRHDEQVLQVPDVPRRDARPALAEPLRPLERQLLRWRDEGADPAKIAAMFRRSPEHIERVMALADYERRSASF
jgi:hypothetical protein